MTSMHSTQWHTCKTQTNQYWSTTSWSSVSNIIHIYTSDKSLLSKDVQITTYTDEITIAASKTKHRKAQQLNISLKNIQMDQH